VLLLVIAAKSDAAGEPARATPARPNIVFILCDDLGYGDLGVSYQNERAARRDRRLPFFQTPRIDTLARDGLWLRQHYAAAPVCAPSRASLLTGRTQGHASVRDNQFDKGLAETITLGSVLQRAGYATAAIGKWGLQGGGEAGRNPPRDRPAAERAADLQRWFSYPTRRGFDFFFGYVRHRDGHFHYPEEDGREIWENDRVVTADLSLCYTTDLFTARAKRWIIEQRAAQPERPFFLYLAYDTPHAVLHNPPGAYPAGGGRDGGVQWTGRSGAMINTATGAKDGWMHPDYAHATWDHDGDAATPEVPWPDGQKRYANSVRRIDDCVGDLLQLLGDLGLAENTLVVFTSDNGPSPESYLAVEANPAFFRAFGPFDGIKRDTLEGGVREPTLVRWPAAVAAGRVSDQPAGQWDWLATFAEVAGVPVPAASDGVSLLPTLTGRGAQRPGTIYVEYFNNQRTPSYAAFAPAHRGRVREQMQVVFVDGLKGLRYQVKSAEDDFEIYDVGSDPQETRNLALEPGREALQARMKARVLQVRRPEASAPRPYDEALVPALSRAPGATGGLRWARYEGDWPWLPALDTLPPTAAGETPQPELSAVERGAGGAVALTGAVFIPADGDYQFMVEGTAEAVLFLHESRVVETGRSDGRVRLQAGWHPLRLFALNRNGSGALRVDVRDASGQPVVFSPTHFAPTLGR
jgi:arylsulfatase A-like enzyme